MGLTHSNIIFVPSEFNYRRFEKYIVRVMGKASTHLAYFVSCFFPHYFYIFLARICQECVASPARRTTNATPKCSSPASVSSTKWFNTLPNERMLMQTLFVASWQKDVNHHFQCDVVLTQQQTRSIEKVVPWFLNTMPEPYFRQVPESFRLDHIKAISAIKDASMDMHMNLKTHLPDGRQVRLP